MVRARLLPLVVLLLLPAAPLGASHAPGFHDAAGDANFVNGQGVPGSPVSDDGPDSRPVSLSGADLVAATYETTFHTVEERDDLGNLVAVRHVPDGLLVRLRTAGPAAPSFGPTVSYALWVTVAGFCNLIFRMYTRGPLSAADEPPQRAELRTRSAGCPEGPKTYTEGITLSFQGAVATMRFPFSALPQYLLEDGWSIDADADGNGGQVASTHRSPNGLLLGGPMIDLAAPAGPFEIGSDVPPDIDCVATPTDPACTEG